MAAVDDVLRVGNPPSASHACVNEICPGIEGKLVVPAAALLAMPYSDPSFTDTNPASFA